MSPTVPPTSVMTTSTSSVASRGSAPDLVGDVGDDLDGVAQVVAPALLGQHRAVDGAGGDAGVAVQVLVDEPLVVAQIEVGLAPVLVTNTSPCWLGFMVPGSTLMYGSSFWRVTRRPLVLRAGPGTRRPGPSRSNWPRRPSRRCVSPREFSLPPAPAWAGDPGPPCAPVVVKSAISGRITALGAQSVNFSVDVPIVRSTVDTRRYAHARRGIRPAGGARGQDHAHGESSRSSARTATGCGGRTATRA